MVFTATSRHQELLARKLSQSNRVLSRKTYYEPGEGVRIARLFQENTKRIWTESPGSYTMEVQDVPAICAVAHDRNVRVVLDNTWSAGILFRAFDHGVDISLQALTKYVGGHSDLLLGAVSVRDDQVFQHLGAAQQMIGFSASPDDCGLALRGLQTLAVRLAAIETSALAIARWLAKRSEIERVLHLRFHRVPVTSSGNATSWALRARSRLSFDLPSHEKTSSRL